MAEGWSKDAVDQTIDAYFGMLGKQLAGTSFVKAGVERKVSAAVGRSTGAVGYKFSNISAILSEEGLVFLSGYGPQHNYQELLRVRVVDRLGAAPALRDHMMTSVLAEPAGAPRELGGPKLPPSVKGPDGRRPARSGRFPDYQEIEQRNRALGKAGEELVVARERRVLTVSGLPRLAAQVSQVAVEKGDGLGYDVRSFRVDGSPRFLEVKTTRSSASQPFFVSRNEVDFSAEKSAEFTLVRVYLFGHPGQDCYELDGDLTASAVLRPEMYTGRPA